ncbi:MAG: IS3 family transposase, partial [Pseudomonadota bacterium]|nr:IS3 family transposase [Pseudomonadota bacterium]
MYSYGDRIRAVRLYIKLGKHTAATLRQSGYPTKNALKRWYREYVRYHDLPVAYVRSRPKYSDKQKRMAVEHYMNHGNCFAWTAKAWGYPGRGTLKAWVNA